MSEPTDEEVQATSLEELLQFAAKDLRNAFDRAAQVKHHGERGRLREIQVLDFLAERLPANYSVGTGHIADARGSVSGQMDGLVFHAASSPKLYTERNSTAYQPGLFFIESVAAVISVKSRLDKKELVDSFGNIASAKSLSKSYYKDTSVVAGNIDSPFNQFGPRQPPIGVVFAYSAVSPKTVVRYIRDLYRDFLAAGQSEYWTIMPEYVFVLDSCLIHTPTWHGSPADPDDEGEGQSFEVFPQLPVISCELECSTNPIMSAFYTGFVERMLEVPILRISYDHYTRSHRHGPTLMAFPAHNIGDVLEGRIEVKRVANTNDDGERETPNDPAPPPDTDGAASS